MNHERMSTSLLYRHSEDDSEVLWSRKAQQAVAACSAYPACAAAGLVNDCCPTSDNVFLGCCAVTSAPGMWFDAKYTLPFMARSVC
jgi:hypothetical protein